MTVERGAEIDVENKNGRRYVHSREFRRCDRLFKDYERAMEWKRGEWE